MGNHIINNQENESALILILILIYLEWNLIFLRDNLYHASIWVRQTNSDRRETYEWPLI